MAVLLIDADGVLIKKQPYFSKRIAAEFNVPYERMEPFYLNELNKCQTGELDMKEELARYLPTWNWTGSVDVFLNYWFTTDVILDEEVLAIVDQLRARGMRCYLATDQEKYRADYIWNTADLLSRLEGSFFSYEVGAMKSSPQYFTHACEVLQVHPKDVLFWDDDEKNVEVAKGVGIGAHHYTDVESFRNAFAELKA